MLFAKVNFNHREDSHENSWNQLEWIQAVNLRLTGAGSMPESALSSSSPNRCLAILVHGFFRTRRDMAFLERGLKRCGYQTLRVHLPSTQGTIEEGVSALQRQLELPMQGAERVVFIAHSMGGLVVRTFLAQINSRANITHCVFIATPHRGTPLADLLLNIPWYGAIFPVVKQLRSKPPNTYAAPLLHPNGHQGVATDIRIGVIAGDYSRRGPLRGLSIGKLLIPARSDGRVPVASAVAPDADAVLIVPFSHTRIHHRGTTLDAIIHFLASGHFNNSNYKKPSSIRSPIRSKKTANSFLRRSTGRLCANRTPRGAVNTLAKAIPTRAGI